MFDIEGHTNCVTSIDEFKDQLPQNFKILSQHELVEERGTRYTLAGEIQ